MFKSLVLPSFLPVAPAHQLLIASLEKLTIYCIDILLKQHSIPLSLHIRHSDVQIDLLLG
jgi:hypothetical protein